MGKGVGGEGGVVELEGFAIGQGDGGGVVGECAEGVASGAGDFAEDGVGHASGFGADVAFGPFDGFVDDGVGGEAVEQEELGGAAYEDGLHAGLDGLESPACQMGDDVAEGDPAGDGFSDNGVAEGSVAGLEVLDLGLDGHQVWKGQCVGTQDAVGGVAGVCGGRG